MPKIEEAEHLAHIIGLKSAEFWKLTPAEWGMVAEGYKKREERMDYRTALICATLWNVHGGRNNRAVSPDEFMPREKKEQTAEEMLQIIMMHNTIHGGQEG